VLGLQVPVRHAAAMRRIRSSTWVMFNWFELPIDRRRPGRERGFVLGRAGGGEDARARANWPARSRSGSAVRQRREIFADTPVGAGRHRFAGVTPGIRTVPLVGSAFLAPVLVRAVAEQDWRDGGGGHDYLIVSHRSLIDAYRTAAEFIVATD
jgi:hypothetical protein